MVEYFSSNAIEFWYLLGAALLIIEMLLGGTIVLFLAGISSFSVALLMKFDFFTLNSLIAQIGAFGASSCFWSIVLWKPANYLITLTRRGEYKNFIGCTAVVHSETLCIETLGEIKWSGTVCKARLTKNSNGHNPKKGENVKIINVENNIFIVEKL